MAILCRPNLGDAPEDLQSIFRQYVMNSLQTAPKKPLDSLLLDLAEIYMMAPQNIVPIFAKPFKTTAVKTLLPPNTLEFINIVTFTVRQSLAAIVTDISESLESIGAYLDCHIRLYYRNESDEWWNPNEPEINGTRIAVFGAEDIIIQANNTNPIVPHYIDAEILGYIFNINNPSKTQKGLRVITDP